MPDLGDPIPPTVVKSGSERCRSRHTTWRAGLPTSIHQRPDTTAAGRPTILADRIDRQRAIALFLYGSADEKAQKRLYHVVGSKRKKEGRKRPPVGKEAGKLVASRAKLRAYWDELSSNKIEGECRNSPG